MEPLVLSTGGFVRSGEVHTVAGLFSECGLISLGGVQNGLVEDMRPAIILGAVMVDLLLL